MQKPTLIFFINKFFYPLHQHSKCQSNINSNSTYNCPVIITRKESISSENRSLSNCGDHSIHSNITSSISAILQILPPNIYFQVISTKAFSISWQFSKIVQSSSIKLQWIGCYSFYLLLLICLSSSGFWTINSFQLPISENVSM